MIYRSDKLIFGYILFQSVCAQLPKFLDAIANTIVLHLYAAVCMRASCLQVMPGTHAHVSCQEAIVVSARFHVIDSGQKQVDQHITGCYMLPLVVYLCSSKWFARWTQTISRVLGASLFKTS